MQTSRNCSSMFYVVDILNLTQISSYELDFEKRHVWIKMTADNVSSAMSIETYQKYVGFGFTAIVCSLIILLVIIGNKSLLKKSSFMIGLCIGDLFQGLSVLTQDVIVFL